MGALSSISVFLDELASDAPTPGGGSAAAASGAMGAALVQMVCRLTLGKKKYADVAEEVRKILSHAKQLQKELTQLMADDAASFDEVLEAYRLPRESLETEARNIAIQAALQKATLIPLKTAKTCGAVIDLCAPLVRIGNINAISDGGVAAVCAFAGLKGAGLNVLINLASIDDPSFCLQHRQTLENLLQQYTLSSNDVFESVQQRILL